MDADKFTKLYSCNVVETCAVLRFHKDARRAYLMTNQGGDVDLIALALLDAETGKTEEVERDPNKRVDFAGPLFPKSPTISSPPSTSTIASGCQSPLNSASKIRTPLLVIQGANDPRVSKHESDQIVAALRDRKFPVEYLVAPDEGHGFARPVNSMAMFAASEKFLAKHLGGRFQEHATPEVAERLKEITVDPATVVLAKKVVPAQAGTPKPTAALQPGTYKFAAQLQMGERSMALNFSTTIKEGGDGWSVTETIKRRWGKRPTRPYSTSRASRPASEA